MTLSTVAVLRPGDWVLYDGSEHQVLALAGTSVRLRTVDGADSVVLAGHLMASPGFAVVDSEPAPSVEPFALLDSLPGAVLDTAREWERHVVEIETGLPPGAEPGVAPKPEYDPTSTTVVDRDRAKAAELGVGVRTVQTRRARYAQQGLWGLVDQRAVRAWEATGRADARLVAAARGVIDAETDTSTGTRSRLIRRVTKAVEATYGPGVVPMPARSTFYRLIDALATGRHTFGSAVTRRQTANRPQGMFTPTHAARPGEFARFLGLEFTGRANITDIVNAVCATAAHTRVELVCVDELHNLNLATRAGAEVSDQLKYFAERLPATFVYAGIDVEAQGLFAGVRGRQIAGRFTVIPAAPFAYGTGAQRGQWRALIAALESLLRLHRHRTGNLVRLDEYLYRRSGGMIGSLSQLVRGAAILAIEDGSEQISKKLLDSASRSTTPHNAPIPHHGHQRRGSRAIRKQSG